MEFFELGPKEVLRNMVEEAEGGGEVEEYAYLMLDGKVLEFDFGQSNEEEEMRSEDMAVFFGRVTEEDRRKIEFRKEVKEIGENYGRYLRCYDPGAFFNFHHVSAVRIDGPRSKVLVSYGNSTLLRISKRNYKEYFEENLYKRTRKYHFLVKEVFPEINKSSESFVIYKKLRQSLIRITYRKGDVILREQQPLNNLFILTKGSLKMTKNLDTEKLDTLLQMLKSKLVNNDELSRGDKQNILMLKNMIKNLRLKLKDIKVHKPIRIAILTQRDLFGEECLSFSKSDRTSVFHIEAAEESEVYCLDSEMMRDTLPHDYYQKLFKLFQKKLEIRMEKFNKESPPLLKEFERKVKETNYNSISDIFGVVNKSEKNNILKNFLRTRVEDENASYLKLPKSQAVMSKIHTKLKGSGRLRQVLRFKKEYSHKNKSKEFFQELFQRERIRRMEQQETVRDGIFSTGRKMRRYKVSNPQKISKIYDVNVIKRSSTVIYCRMMTRSTSERTILGRL